MNPEKLISPEKALEIILEDVQLTSVRNTAVVDSLFRVLAKDVFSAVNLPPYNKAAMDGYAYQKDDESTNYHIVETIPAGHVPLKSISKGHCSKIMTGGMVPKGADRIIPFERAFEKNGFMTICKIDHGKHICAIGENITKGEMVFSKGTFLRPQEIATLSAIGLNEVFTHFPPKLGIISTGSEIIGAGCHLKPGTIYDSNGPQLLNQARALSIPAKYYGICEDDPSQLEKFLSVGIDQNELLIITGGVSKGDFDFIPGVLKSLKTEIKFEQVEIKPGRPMIFGKNKKCFIFGLPGNPVATFILFEIFVKPLALRLMGHHYQPRISKWELGEKIVRKKADRHEYFPVKIVEDKAYPLRANGPSHINLMCQASGLICMEKGIEVFEKNTLVAMREI
ncbi:MAG: molybdopterin molybdotransferase MoeA [Candidatus Riflebacteria bacterium]|nr:molybdopterin molybdotransferase MoeA [Candidatus Riflebacteria bacterium]